jgi:hypothetical protein
MHELLGEMEVPGADSDFLRSRLVPFEQQAVVAGSGFWTSAKGVMRISLGTRIAQHRLRRDILALPRVPGSTAALAQQQQRQLIAQSAFFFEAVRRAAEFAFYDRMLRLWHLLHLPLFFILVGTAILHIIAVHMY